MRHGPTSARVTEEDLALRGNPIRGSCVQFSRWPNSELELSVELESARRLGGHRGDVIKPTRVRSLTWFSTLNQFTDAGAASLSASLSRLTDVPSSKRWHSYYRHREPAICHRATGWPNPRTSFADARPLERGPEDQCSTTHSLRRPRMQPTNFGYRLPSPARRWEFESATIVRRRHSAKRDGFVS